MYQLNAVNAKLEYLEREHCVLSHKLADKEAALELEVNLRRTKSQEVEKLKEEYNVLKKEENMWLTQFQILSCSAQAVEKTLLHSLLVFKKAVGKMSLFDERLKFAGCRIHFISGMFLWIIYKVISSMIINLRTLSIRFDLWQDYPENHFCQWNFA